MNIKGADQTAQMRRLFCAVVVRKPPEDRFSCIEAHICTVSPEPSLLMIHNIRK